MSVPIVLRGGILVTNGSSLPTDSFGVVKSAPPVPVFASMSVRGSNMLVMDETATNATAGVNIVFNTDAAAASAGTYT